MMARALAAGLALLAWIGWAASAEGHRLDDCLQAALIEIGREETTIQLNINPGVEVSDGVIWMIDRDGDGEISEGEAEAYAKAVMKELRLLADDLPLTLTLVEARSDSVAELRNGSGNFHIEMRARTRRWPGGKHAVIFENRNLPEISSYLVNALLPRDAGIQISKQERNENQSIGRIYFEAEGRSGVRWNLATGLAAGVVMTLASAAITLIINRKRNGRAGAMVRNGRI